MEEGVKALVHLCLHNKVFLSREIRHVKYTTQHKHTHGRGWPGPVRMHFPFLFLLRTWRDGTLSMTCKKPEKPATAMTQ